MDRSRLRQHVETFVVVTVITVLVWLYAENKNVQRYVDQPIRVTFVSSEGDEIDISPKTDQLRIAFRGSSGQKQQLERLKQQGPIKIAVDIPGGAETFTDQVRLKQALINTELGDLGIQILQTDPAEVEVTLRRMQTIPMPIEIEIGDAAVQGKVEVEPAKVTARMPMAISQSAKDAGVVASLETLDLTNLSENVEHTRQVSLTLPEPLQGREIRLEPDQAQVTFTIAKKTATTTLTSVPIHLNAPPLLLERYDIQLPGDQLVLHNVKLTGPSDVIERIEGKQVRVWAELRPSADQLAPGQVTLEVHVKTPPEVTVETPPGPITVSVRRRRG